MAWIQKRGNTWWIGYRADVTENGITKRIEIRESCKTSDKKIAEAQLAKQRAIEIAHQANALTKEYIEALTGKKLPQRRTATEFLDSWLKDAEGATTHRTMLKYRQLVREFKAHTKCEALGLMMEEINADHIRAFLAEKRLRSSEETVKGFRRILSSIFLNAQNLGLINGNPVALVKASRRAKEEKNEKRPFTLAEVKDLHSKATPFWRYMIQAAFFTGQSLGDLVTLTRANVDLSQNVISLTRRKTGTHVKIPIAKPLRKTLESIWPRKAEDFFWPDEAQRYLRSGASSFSQEFYELLASAGLVAPRAADKESTGKGRNNKRVKTILGFHNLRHTFITNLKIGGAVDSVAKELAGHGSTAINTHYTHLPAETLANAVNKLPEVGQ